MTAAGHVAGRRAADAPSKAHAAAGELAGGEQLRVLVGEERALELISTALAASRADETEIFLAARTSSVLRFADDRIHQPQDLASLQLMVRAVVGDRSARVATSSPAALGEAVERAVGEAVELAATPRRRGQTAGKDLRPGGAHLPAGPSTGGTPPPGLLWSDATASWSASDRARQLSALVALGRWRAGEGAAELAGVVAAGTTELAVVTSRGARRYAAATEASFSCTARRAAGSSRAEELGRDAAAIDIEEIGETLIGEAAAMRGAIELPAGEYDVVFGPQAAAELVAFLPAFGFTAPALAAGVGVVAAGRRRFSPLVTVADDATAGPGLPFPFDCEGSDTRRVELISRGAPRDVVSDLASAAVTGGSTGHAHIAREEAPAPKAASLRLEPGSSTTEELVAGVEQGVYVQRLWYTRVVDAARGLITGTTRDAAFLIRDGRLDRPVTGTRFTESVLDALERVDGLGAELHGIAMMNVWNGATLAPATRVRGFRLGVGVPRRPGGAAAAGCSAPSGGRSPAGRARGRR